MSTIHQIYCTHCTYGSSALERRGGELARRMLGYSVRAGSAEAQELRQYYRQVEQYLYYYLPRDTPAEEKLQLTAATAPRRLIYLPSSGALQVLAQICYRQTDTEGRPGSYFAHVLFHERQDREAGWSPLDCLKLWGAAGWVRQDTVEIPFRLRPLGELGEMLAGAPPAIDDRVLLSFLTAPGAGELHDPAGVIPDRWRRQEAAVRRRVFAEAFAMLLEAARQPGKSLLLVIEPSMAALFFYGMLRLLPDNAVSRNLSFSTFEPNPERLCTALAATWFCTPEKADLRPAALRTSAAVLSTIESQRLPIQHAEDAYAPWVLDRLLQGGWDTVDRALADFRAVGAESFEDLEYLARTERLLLDVSVQGELPPDCEWLWQEAAEPFAAHVPFRHQLLPLLLARLEADVIERFYRTSAERHFETFVANLAEAARTAAAARVALTRIVRSFDPSALPRLYRRYGPELFRHYPQDEPALGEKLHELLRTLASHLAEFSERLEVILAAEPLLPSDLDRRAAAAWVRCRRAILDIGALEHRRNILRLRPWGPLEDAARQMAEAIAQAMPRDWFDDDREGTNKQQCLCQLGHTLLKGKTLLPAGVWQYAALWRKIGWYFESGKWPGVRLRAMRRRTRRRRPRAAASPPPAIQTEMKGATGCLSARAAVDPHTGRQAGHRRAPTDRLVVGRGTQPITTDLREHHRFWMLVGGTIGLLVVSIGIVAWLVWSDRGATPEALPQPPTAKEAPANTAAVQEEVVPQPMPSRADAPRQDEPAPPSAQTGEQPPTETAPMAAEVKPPPAPEAAAEPGPEPPPPPRETLRPAEAAPPAAGHDEPPNIPPPAQPPAADNATAVNVVQIAGQLKVDISPLRRRLDRPYVAELNILVPAASFPKRFGVDQANCTVREVTAGGGERTKRIGEVFKKKTYLLLDDIVSLDVRFEFDRTRNLLPGQTPQKIAETPWYPIDSVEKGKEYTILFYPAREAFEKP